MINDPKMIDKLLKDFKSVPKEIIKQAIKEVIEEDEYISELNNIEYKSKSLYSIMIEDIFNFEMLHISTSIQNKNRKIQIEEAA